MMRVPLFYLIVYLGVALRRQGLQPSHPPLPSAYSESVNLFSCL